MKALGVRQLPNPTEQHSYSMTLGKLPSGCCLGMMKNNGVMKPNEILIK